MSDEILEGLLSGVGRGDEELHDPREGDHDATFQDARLVENGPTAQVKHAIVITYGGMEDSEGRDFTFDDRVNLPSSESNDNVKRMFLVYLHSLGIVSYDDRRPYFADTEEQRAAFVDVFKTRVGARLQVSIKTDGAGWPRLRIKRG